MSNLYSVNAILIDKSITHFDVVVKNYFISQSNKYFIFICSIRYINSKNWSKIIFRPTIIRYKKSRPKNNCNCNRDYNGLLFFHKYLYHFIMVS